MGLNPLLNLAIQYYTKKEYFTTYSLMHRNPRKSLEMSLKLCFTRRTMLAGIPLFSPVCIRYCTEYTI